MEISVPLQILGVTHASMLCVQIPSLEAFEPPKEVNQIDPATSMLGAYVRYMGQSTSTFPPKQSIDQIHPRAVVLISRFTWSKINIDAHTDNTFHQTINRFPVSLYCFVKLDGY